MYKSVSVRVLRRPVIRVRQRLLADDLHVVNGGLDEAGAARVGRLDLQPDRLARERAQIDRRRRPHCIVVVAGAQLLEHVAVPAALTTCTRR